jgi:hypothetical protein
VPAPKANPEEYPAPDEALAPVAMLDAKSQTSPLLSFANPAEKVEQTTPLGDVVGTPAAGIRLQLRNLFRKLDGQLVARICACVLVLSVTPALDAPAPHTVSAQNVVGAPTTSSPNDGEVAVSAAELSTADDVSDMSTGSLPNASQNANERLALENIWKTELHTTATRNLVSLPYSNRMIDLQPLAPTPVQAHLIASTLPLAPEPSGARTPAGRTASDNAVHTTSDALWPATCRQERYASLYSLMGIARHGQAQPTAVCSFFATPASELSAK